MNEYDYNMIQIISIVITVTICLIFTFFIAFFNIEITPIVYILYINILIIGFIISMFAHIKKKLYVIEMERLKNGKNENNRTPKPE